MSDIKGVGAEDKQGVRLIWQKEIRFLLLLHYLQRAILLKYKTYIVNIDRL